MGISAVSPLERCPVFTVGRQSFVPGMATTFHFEAKPPSYLAKHEDRPPWTVVGIRCSAVKRSDVTVTHAAVRGLAFVAHPTDLLDLTHPDLLDRVRRDLVLTPRSWVTLDGVVRGDLAAPIAVHVFFELERYRP